MTRHQHDLFRWLAYHVAAIVVFAGLTALAASGADIELTTGWGSVMRHELILASGTWGSWMFLARAETHAARVVAKFTVLAPGLAMLGMSAVAYAEGAQPDRWSQWILAGLLCVVLAWRPNPRRSMATNPLLFAVGAAAAVTCWIAWLPGAVVMNDPTLGLWWGAPLVAVLTSTALPRIIAGKRGAQMLDASTVQV